MFFLPGTVLQNARCDSHEISFSATFEDGIVLGMVRQVLLERGASGLAPPGYICHHNKEKLFICQQEENDREELKVKTDNFKVICH